MKKIGIIIALLVIFSAGWYLVLPIFINLEVNEESPIAGSISEKEALSVVVLESEISLCNNLNKIQVIALFKEYSLLNNIKLPSTLGDDPFIQLTNCKNSKWILEYDAYFGNYLSLNKEGEVINNFFGDTESEFGNISSDAIISNDQEIDEPMVEMEPEMSIETRGSFTGADNAHKGSGELKVIKDNNKTFLRFENFSVTNGPDLFVTLNSGDSPKGEHIIVEGLKGNKGNQNYDISEYNLEDYKSVSIYCRAFSVEFATAQL